MFWLRVYLLWLEKSYQNDYKCNMKSRPRVLVVCNAIDDDTRTQRRIETDSPAASRKVFEMCRAMRKVGVDAYVLSLGRGRADGSSDTYSSRVCRIGGVPVIYAAFSHRYIWSELLSLFGLLKPLKRLSQSPDRAVIFYNRMPAYLLLLLFAGYFGYRRFLDLEDGEISTGRGLKKHVASFVLSQFDKMCREGALLACRALADMTSIRPTLPYYGTAVTNVAKSRWQSEKITCLMSGTLSVDTGAPLLVETIRLLRIRDYKWADMVQFEVTGKGDYLNEFKALEIEPGWPKVHVHGRLTDVGYQDVLRCCEIGLALKPVGGGLSDTTFPSKVVEFAASGLLVVSTDISDVREIFGNNALYLERNDPELLIRRFQEVIYDRETAEHCASLGNLSIMNQCDPQSAGQDLKTFIFRGIE